MAMIAEIEPSMAMKSADLDHADAAKPDERWSLPGFVLLEGRSISADDGPGSDSGEERPCRRIGAVREDSILLSLEEFCRGNEEGVEEGLEGLSHGLARSLRDRVEPRPRRLGRLLGSCERILGEDLGYAETALAFERRVSPRRLPSPDSSKNRSCEFPSWRLKPFKGRA